MNKLFKERRKKHWASEIGIDWMDGMPLTLAQISTFCKDTNLLGLLEDLVYKGYLVKEYPKKLVKQPNGFTTRVQDETKEIGYNIVAGKLSFEFTKILDVNDIAPTLVATDVVKLGVVDNGGVRKLTLREGLRMFGYPETYTLNFIKTKKQVSEGFDLLGNTVVVPIIKLISARLLQAHKAYVSKNSDHVHNEQDNSHKLFASN
jgi:DNA (cytosine-5)-methyltransferase 1